ncbi:MAG: hypothetical protein LIO90_02215 [Bacteroidales bacterium]|nr:hypothetical protein [Bacteroidales bacterium]
MYTVVKRLNQDINLGNFDCGDTDLNEFLKEEALAYQEKRIAFTYLILSEDEVIGYFSLLNDKISKTDVTKAEWRKLEWFC